VVVVGGGTGTHTILRGLKKYADKIDITAIVTMADSGGSTGRLRDEFGQLPVGDVRMALAALSADTGPHEELLRELFLYRFDKGAGLAGHNFGNLFLTALTEILGSSSEAIKTASEVLRVAGRVLPVTTDNVHLVATYDDGVVVVGEHEIDTPAAERCHNTIVNVCVTPAAKLNPEAAEAIALADMIILGPGDLYTSIIANLVVDGFKAALVASPAKIVYVGNLMSRPGQTSGMQSSDYVSEIAKYSGRTPDCVLINNALFPADLLARYALEGTHPVVHNSEVATYATVTTDLVSTESVTTAAGDVIKRSLIRHDSDKLAAVVLEQLGLRYY
jgi:uncharacterized cofD-like protein